MPLWTPYCDDQPLDLSKARGTLSQHSSESGGHSPASIGSRCESWSLSDVYQGGSPSPPQIVPDTSRLPTCHITEGSFKHTNASRPFKAVSSTLPADCDPNYEVFKSVMLDAMRARNGGSLTVSNPRMRRAVRRSNDSSEDDDYLERRARNNAAAKRSRDLRRQKEDELAIRAAYLVNVNAELKAKLQVARRCDRCLNFI